VVQLNDSKVPGEKPMQRAIGAPLASEASGETPKGAEPPALDTLAQLSQGTEAAAAVLLRRARAKYMTVPLSITLAELRSPLEKAYRNTFYCSSTLEQEDGLLKAKHCGNRWCLVCNRIRTARAISNYLPVIGGWSDAYLVTLTLPNVTAELLASTISEMLKSVVAISRAIRRTDRLPFRALRKVECTHNAERDDYHPHFHLIVDGARQASRIVARWLSAHPGASPEAQDMRPCDGSSLKEFFKYFTKLMPARSASGLPRTPIPPGALNEIFLAMKGRRVYQPMGFRLPPAVPDDGDEDLDTKGGAAAIKRLGEVIVWDWTQQLHDWVDFESGELLTGYEPSPAVVGWYMPHQSPSTSRQ
jgi:hypothetical protein